MATREQVLAAYAANPKAELNPNEEAINFWMNNDLGQFNTLVDQVRAANPTLAAQIDAQRAAVKTNTGGTTGGAGGGTGGGTGGVTGGGTVDNAALYRQLVTDAYRNIGRTGFGTGTNQIDQSGYDFWIDALQTGKLTPENFSSSFNRAVSQYIAEKPTDPYSKYVQPIADRNATINPFSNIGLLQTQPVSKGAPAVTNYQPQTLAQNFQNYMGIPIGAQYNPGVTVGGASPYSQIMDQTKPFSNPYENVVANTIMGGYNPMLYENARAADAAAANTAATLGTAPEFSKGGMVDSLLGPNPKGPDDGLAALDLGEYVIKKSSVDKYGKGLLDMINEGKLPVKKAKSLLF